MNICIAQIKSLKGDILSNIEKHIKFIELAHLAKADSIFFPELSLTGYEPELAQELATNQDDKRFDIFQKISNLKKMTIGVGVPTNSDNEIEISMIVFQPNKSRTTYSKQQLHEDELPYFKNGNKQVILEIENKKVIPAICYKSLQTEHAAKGINPGGEIYLASVAKSGKGIDKAFIHYPEVAKTYAIPVLMVNCIGECDTFISAGLSSVWTKNGIAAGQLDTKNEGILIFDTQTEEVSKKTI